MNLDSSKTFCLDCIPVVVLKNCEPDLSFILAELFNKCFKESYFPDCWKVSSVVFKNVGERPTAKNCRPVSLLSVVSEVIERLVNDRIVDHVEKCVLFPDFQYGFRSSWWTWDLLTVVCDRIAKAFDKVWHAGLLHKPKSVISLNQDKSDGPSSGPTRNLKLLNTNSRPTGNTLQQIFFLWDISFIFENQLSL